jgi:hypothetical protein
MRCLNLLPFGEQCDLEEIPFLREERPTFQVKATFSYVNCIWPLDAVMCGCSRFETRVKKSHKLQVGENLDSHVRDLPIA